MREARSLLLFAEPDSSRRPEPTDLRRYCHGSNCSKHHRDN